MKNRFSGILAVGKTREEAIASYSATALGKNAAMLANAKGLVFASQSSVAGKIKCPVTGGVLTNTPSLLAHANFASESDATVGVKVQYTRCLDGCKTHIIADNADILKKCPMCSHSMAEVTDARIAAEESDTANLVVTGSDMESASQALRDAFAGSVVINDRKDTGFTFESNSAVKYNAFTGKRVTDAEISEQCVSLSGSAPTDSVKVHMLSCSGSCDQPVTLSTTPDAVYCTHCRSPLVDPEAVEGMRRSMSAATSDDDDDEEDDFDLGDDDEFDLDDEDMESDSSDDYDSGDDDDDDDDDDSAYALDDDDADDADDDLMDDFDDSDSDDSLMDDDDSDDDEDMESDSASKKKKSKVKAKKHKKEKKGSGKKIAKKSSNVKSTKAEFDEVFADEDDKSRKSLWMKYLQACRKKAQTAQDFADAQGNESTSAKSCSCGKASCSKCGDGDDDSDDAFIDEDDIDDLDFEGDDEEMESDSSKVNVDMLEALSSAGVKLDAADIQLSFVEASGKQPARWFAYHNGTPIAHASQASMSSAVGEESAHAMFNSPRVPRAFAHVAAEKGVGTAIEELGFKSMSMDVDVGSVIQARAQAEADQKVANVTAEVESHCEEYQDRMVAALSTAMVGIQRGFWRNEHNPVVQQLVTSLSSAGIANPEPLVAQAFATQGEQLFKSVMSKALELMQKPVEVQNELAASISGMGNVASVDDANVEDRLANVGNVVHQTNATKQVIESQSSAAGKGDYANRALMLLRRQNGLI